MQYIPRNTRKDTERMWGTLLTIVTKSDDLSYLNKRGMSHLYQKEMIN
jgi:hypothetical protein